jgi:hypothetical protein
LRRRARLEAARAALAAAELAKTFFTNKKTKMIFQ